MHPMEIPADVISAAAWAANPIEGKDTTATVVSVTGASRIVAINNVLVHKM